MLIFADSRDILFTHKVNDREVINNKKVLKNIFIT